MNPQSPKLYGLIKNHKPGNPIRPVVSYINSPTRELSIKLNATLKEKQISSHLIVKKIH